MEIAEKTRQFVIANFYVRDAAQLKNSTSLLETGIVDSTGVLELISFIEETFGVSVEEDEMVPANLDGIDRITAYVQKKLA